MPAVSLSKRELGIALAQLAKHDDQPARLLYNKLAGGWQGFFASRRLDREYCTVKLYDHEFDTYQRLPIAQRCKPLPSYIAVYSDPENPKTEVTVLSIIRPPKRRTFKVAGGRTRLTRVKIRKITNNEQEYLMARKAKIATPADDELDGLEGLDELDLEDEDEDEAPAKPKKESAAAKKKRLAAEAAADDDDEDDEDEDEEDEEDEEPKETASQRRRREKREAAAAAAKPKKKDNRKPPPRTELPDGKFGPTEIGEMAGVSGREVRIYLRKKNIAKSEALGRYAFSKGQAEKIAKAISK